MNHLRRAQPSDIPKIAQLLDLFGRYSQKPKRPFLQFDNTGRTSLLIDSWQSCYRDFLPQSFLECMKVAKQIQRHRQIMKLGTRYFIVEEECGSLQGFASFGPTRSAALAADVELYTLYVDIKSQKKGI